jgi:tripartite-type tricarboxylate transporter receptor subunit TctC
MKLPRRQFLKLAIAAGLPPGASAAWALDYPVRPIRIVVGFPPGGGADLAARLMGQWLSERLRQPVVVENRPGAATNIATETVVRALPDGYTLLDVTATNAINASLYKKLNFNFARDVAPVAGIMRVPNVMVVNRSLPVTTVLEFIAYAKANSGKIAMASGGNGTSSHMAGELFKMMAGVDLLHVPYRGAAPAVTALLGGQVQVMFETMPATIEYVRAGTLRALAVTTATSSEALPGVPTLGAFVPGYEVSTWYGLGAPGSTPSGIIEALNREIDASLTDPTIKARLTELGATAISGSPEDFRKFIATEIDKWAKVVAFAGLTAE